MRVPLPSARVAAHDSVLRFGTASDSVSMIVGEVVPRTRQGMTMTGCGPYRSMETFRSPPAPAPEPPYESASDRRRRIYYRRMFWARVILAIVAFASAGLRIWVLLTR